MAIEDEMAAAAAEAGLPAEPELPLGAEGGMPIEGSPMPEGEMAPPPGGPDIGVDYDSLFNEIDQFAALLGLSKQWHHRECLSKRCQGMKICSS